MAKGQQSFSFRTHGGKRKGAGAKPKGARAGVRHRTRPEHKRNHPVLVTLRTVPEVGRLRTKDTYRVVQRAMVTSFGTSLWKRRCRICYLSVQGNHLHLLVEAEDKLALSRGMQGFQISCAKRLNAEISRQSGEERHGKVFADRFHATDLKNPKQVRNCISYVLSNWRKHGESRALIDALDAYATGWHFDGWDEEFPPRLLASDARVLPVWFPWTWLLDKGWRRYGPISAWSIPGSRS